MNRKIKITLFKKIKLIIILDNINKKLE